MSDTRIFLDFLPFWIVNYALAAVMWSCVGRFLLGWFVPGLQPANYIWRAFVMLTGWAVAATAFITPSVVRPVWLPLFAAFWLYWLRTVFYLVMAGAGLTPRLAGGG